MEQLSGFFCSMFFEKLAIVGILLERPLERSRLRFIRSSLCAHERAQHAEIHANEIVKSRVDDTVAGEIVELAQIGRAIVLRHAGEEQRRGIVNVDVAHDLRIM